MQVVKLHFQARDLGENLVDPKITAPRHLDQSVRVQARLVESVKPELGEIARVLKGDPLPSDPDLVLEVGASGGQARESRRVHFLCGVGPG